MVQPHACSSNSFQLGASVSALHGAQEAVRQACEATKGQGYEVAYEVYMRAAARNVNAFVIKAGTLGYTWPRSKK